MYSATCVASNSTSDAYSNVSASATTVSGQLYVVIATCDRNASTLSSSGGTVIVSCSASYPVNYSDVVQNGKLWVIVGNGGTITVSSTKNVAIYKVTA